MGITAAAWSWREAFRIVAPSNNYCFPTVFSPQNHTLSSPIRPYPFRQIPTTSCVVHSKKRNARSEAVLKPSIVDEVLPDDEDDDLLFDEFEDGNHYFVSLVFVYLIFFISRNLRTSHLLFKFCWVWNMYEVLGFRWSDLFSCKRKEKRNHLLCIIVNLFIF